MKKSIIIASVIVLLGISLFFFLQNRSNEEDLNTNGDEKDASVEKVADEELIQCLADAEFVIYGSATCPACQELIKSLGGKDLISPLYVECSEEWEKCEEGMKTAYVPEIQIGGELFEGERTFEGFAKETDCKF